MRISLFENNLSMILCAASSILLSKRVVSTELELLQGLVVEIVAVQSRTAAPANLMDMSGFRKKNTCGFLEITKL